MNEEALFAQGLFFDWFSLLEGLKAVVDGAEYIANDGAEQHENCDDHNSDENKN